ncbi:MAG: 16S rRNA (adenine(1518)-N(6)/adenine(1519)-N(6))-dimethyltransferase RsmA [Mogibacterium sp.]|nr:16S rRNA (adenine(1518)-N(6)/adenine(1519)-N(6))-dimethyltransferase RsmA [Mogibacterium sp.]
MGSKRQKKTNNAPAPGFRHQKKLGQNFLTDPEIVRGIAAASGADRDTLVIEIGPGEGVLTEALSDLAGHVTAIELDERLLPILRVRLFNRDNIDIVQGDILQTDLNTLIPERLAAYGLSEARIVGNLPYYITTPILMKLLEENVPAGSVTVMVQKEVGERLAAAPGSRDAGAITYTVHYYCTVTPILEVGRECFTPAPKVDSVVVRLDRRDAPPVETADPDRMFRLIKTGFMQRRKTLLNALSALPMYTREDLTAALAAAGIDPSRRAESLTLQDFARLADELTEA